MSDPYHKRVRDFFIFDHAEMVTVPRYKTSDLSGDEWRTSVCLRAYFKGVCIFEESYRDIPAAALALLNTCHNGIPIPEGVLTVEKTTCDQQGCSNQAIGRLQLKRETSSEGLYLETDVGFEHNRQFCREHIIRGDCDREDADQNYIPLDGFSAQDATAPTPSPSAFGGVIEVDLSEEP